MSVVLAKRLIQKPGRFAYLMGLYAENYWRLTRVFDPQRLDSGSYRSSSNDGLDLCLELLEQHAYTTELKLSYLFHDGATGVPDPSAHVRLYRDARMAEVTHCYVGNCLEDALGRFADARTVFEHRLRMNSFLNKWLEYLDTQGHSRFTLQRVPELV
jgi:hypothetical protein